MKRVLVVEDNALNAELIVQLLEDDYALLLAENGAEGVQVALAERPDLILMDMSMPVMNGTLAMQTIKADPAGSAIPIVAVTANAIRGSCEAALESGFDAYLSKPVDEDALLEVLERYLGGNSVVR